MYLQRLKCHHLVQKIYFKKEQQTFLLDRSVRAATTFWNCVWKVPDEKLSDYDVLRVFLNFTRINQQNAQYCFVDIYITIWHWIFLHVLIQKGSSSENQTEPIRHENKLATSIHSWQGVKEFHAMLFWFGTLMTIACGSKHLGIFSAIWHKFLRKNIVHLLVECCE